MQKVLAVLVIAACSDLAMGVRGRSRALRVTTGMKEAAERHINDWSQQHLSKNDAVNLAGFARGLDASEAQLLDEIIRASGEHKQIPSAQATELTTIIDNMLSGINTSHTTDQQTITTAYGSFAQCATTVTAEETLIQGYQQSYNSKVTSHTTARRAEGTALDEKTTCISEKAGKDAEKTRTQEAFKSLLGKPACAQCEPPAGSATDAARLAWLNGQKDCYKQSADAVDTAKTAFDAAVLDAGSQDCTTKVSTYATKKSEADVLLQGLESDSCAAAKGQHAKCQTLDACYDSAVQSYNEVKSQVQTQIDNRKVQWRGNTRIKCIITAMGTNTVDAITECLKKVLDDTHLNVVFQDAPTDANCAPLTEYPCTEAYTTKVYVSEFARLNMTACNTCDVSGASGGGSQAYADYSPMWCTGSYRGPDLGAAASAAACFALCGQCSAVEWWEGGSTSCYKCSDPAQRQSYTSTTDGKYPPHVLVKQASTTATTTQAVSYDIRGDNTNPCPHQLARAECAHVATARGSGIGADIFSLSNRPGGCYEWDNGDFFYNDHPTGGSISGAKPVCKAILPWVRDTSGDGKTCLPHVTLSQTQSVPDCIALAEADSRCKGIIFQRTGAPVCVCATDNPCTPTDNYDDYQMYVDSTYQAR